MSDRIEIVQSHSGGVAGLSLCHAIVCLKKVDLNVILDRQAASQKHFERVEGADWVEHAFGEGSGATHKKGQSYNLAWWDPDSHAAEEYIFYNYYENNPTTWIFLKICDASHGRKLVYIRFESD
ncbi:MAG: hypothetical protein HYV27_00935 [Candidatus Hydrogenedentes bacterium]|nr:hypothetical protein [Candidatus Hydrogenedentota bacterium]